MLKLTAESFGLAAHIYKAFQFSYFEILAVKSEVIIEYLGKHAQYCCFILVDRALDVDVKENRFCWYIRAADNRGVHHRVVKFVLEEVHGTLPCDLSIGQQIRQHFKEVGFTASKETRNPDSDFICRMVYGFRVVIEKSIEMAAEFLGDNIFAKFLYETLLVVLRHLYNTVDITVYVLLEHTLNIHCDFLQLK